MTQISRPFQIALAAVVLLAAVWFVALRGHSSSGSSSTPAASAPAPAPRSASSTLLDRREHEPARRRLEGRAGADLERLRARRRRPHTRDRQGERAPSMRIPSDFSGRPPRRRTSRRSSKASSSTAQTVIVLFWSPKGAVDVSVRRQLAQLHGRAQNKDVAVHYSSSAEVGEYGKITGLAAGPADADAARHQPERQDEDADRPHRRVRDPAGDRGSAPLLAPYTRSCETTAEELRQHLERPLGRGHVPHDACTGAAGGAACGDLIRISLALDPGSPDGVIADAGFDASGCGASIAAGSAVVALLRGAPLLDAARIGSERDRRGARRAERRQATRRRARRRRAAPRARRRRARVTRASPCSRRARSSR